MRTSALRQSEITRKMVADATTLGASVHKGAHFFMVWEIKDLLTVTSFYVNMVNQE